MPCSGIFPRKSPQNISHALSDANPLRRSQQMQSRTALDCRPPNRNPLETGTTPFHLAQAPFTRTISPHRCKQGLSNRDQGCCNPQLAQAGRGRTKLVRAVRGEGRGKGKTASMEGAGFKMNGKTRQQRRPQNQRRQP